ncbi:hypothetical protein HZS_5850 [Henneguya salminicola]|nr:hypothetical protein HZS_5850 [Henneguya salminicola]
MFRINPVFFYIPNIIDYFRILLLAAACFYMSRNYVTTLILYGISQFLDCIDGYVARLLNQIQYFFVKIRIKRLQSSSIRFCISITPINL